MPANPRADQIVDDSGVDDADYVYISLRGSSDREDKTDGYIDRNWFVTVEDLAVAMAGNAAFVAALLAALDGETEPTWATP